MKPFNAINLLALASSALATTTKAATTSANPTTHQAKDCPTPLHINIIAYEFPFCLAGKGLLENLFLSRPTDTKLSSTRANECVPVNASKGVPHSFFYTVDGGSVASCKLVTYDQEGCKGGRTERSLGVGFSECFTEGDKLVKPIIKAARVECAK